MSAGEDRGEAYRGAFSGETQRGLTLKILATTAHPLRRSCAGFPRKSYQHMANESALPVAVVAPGARATSRW